MFTRLNVVLFPKILIQYGGSGKHIQALDGLRGLAILLVILFHTFHFLFGWCGVDLFFVLSGFLITGTLIDSKENPHYFLNFWIKRVLRIFPVYYLILAIIIIPKIYFKINTVSYTSWTYWFYLQNWQYVVNGVFPDGKATLNHFWSLAIEEQFYFIFPFIVKNVKNKTMPFLLLTLIFISILFRFHYFNTNNIGYYVGTFSRMDSLAVGAFLAYTIRYNRVFLEKWVHLFFYVSFTYITGVILLTNEVHFSNPYFAGVGLTFFALLFGSLLIFSISEYKNNFFKQFLTLKPLLFLGKISYGLYIYHWILYVFIKPPLESLIYTYLADSLASKVVTSLLILTIGIILSYLSFIYFEKKVLKLKTRWIK